MMIGRRYRIASVEMDAMQMELAAQRKMVVNDDAVVPLGVDGIEQTSAIVDVGVGFAQMQQVDAVFVKESVDGIGFVREKVG